MILALLVGGAALMGGAYYAERHMKHTEGAFVVGWIVGALTVGLLTVLA